jgi:hypothetical protein
MVGWYNYAPIDTHTHPTQGRALDWSMKVLLATQGRDLAKFGWRKSRTPLLGIGQAWSGRYDKRQTPFPEHEVGHPRQAIATPQSTTACAGPPIRRCSRVSVLECGQRGRFILAGCWT